MLHNDGTIECAGPNYGDLGLGPEEGVDAGDAGADAAETPDHRIYRMTPLPGVSTATDFSIGGGGGCAVLSDKTLSCWGTVSPDLSWTPSTVTGLSGVVQVSAGNVQSCVVLVDGSVKCWETGTTKGRAPKVVAGLSSIIQVATMDGHTCALRGDGDVLCWGRNDHGQLGDGTKIDRPAPTLVKW